jgi:UDP-glucose 4-epimerase
VRRMTNRRILVVGLGFLGSAMVLAAARKDFEVRVLTRSKPTVSGCWSVAIGDAGDRDLVLRVSNDVHHIIYAAGGSLPSAAELDPIGDLARSLPPLLNVLDACGSVGCGLTLLSSGGTVYGKPEILPIPEHHPTNPASSYGIRMLAAEKHAIMRAERLGFHAGILRIGNAFGSFQPLRRSQGIIATLLHNLLHNKTTNVFGDGHVVRDYIHVDDVASTALQLLEAPRIPAIVNVGTGKGLSILDLISICNSVTGRKAQVTFDQSRIFDVRTNILDIGRLSGLIDFNPTPPDAAIRQMWNDMAG